MRYKIEVQDIVDFIRERPGDETELLEHLRNMDTIILAAEEERQRLQERESLAPLTNRDRLKLLLHENNNLD